MAAKRRKREAVLTVQRAPTGMGFSGWFYVISGLIVGIALVLMAQYAMTHLKALSEAQRSQTAEKKQARQPKQAQEKKASSYDFYTILPEIETVITDLTDTIQARKNRHRTAYNKPSAEEEKAEPESDVRYLLQAASYQQPEDADRLKAQLALNGMEAFVEKVWIQDKGNFYRVRLGPYKQYAELDGISARLEKMGIKAMRLRIRQR